MSVAKLQQYLPENSLIFLKRWIGNFYIHIKITKDRSSKLGDYRKLRDQSHEITINSTLEPELFFFVLTHELAHLIAFEKFNFRISPHGKEWKITYREMLLESLSVYSEELKPMIQNFAKSPKANFMSSDGLVRYFRPEKHHQNEFFIENFAQGEQFVYRKQRYEIEQKLKKNYLCKNLENGRRYVFKPLAKVEKFQK